jgi:hypothetical protein
VGARAIGSPEESSSREKARAEVEAEVERADRGY